MDAAGHAAEAGCRDIARAFEIAAHQADELFHHRDPLGGAEGFDCFENGREIGHDTPPGLLSILAPVAGLSMGSGGMALKLVITSRRRLYWIPEAFGHDRSESC